MWGEEIPLIGTLLHGNINAFDGLFFFFFAKLSWQRASDTNDLILMKGIYNFQKEFWSKLKNNTKNTRIKS